MYATAVPWRYSRVHWVSTGWKKKEHKAFGTIDLFAEQSIQNHLSYFMQETFFSRCMCSLFLECCLMNFFFVCGLWRHTIDSRLLLTMVWWGMERHRWRMLCGFFWTLCQKKIITFLRFSVICSFTILFCLLTSSFWLILFLHILYLLFHLLDDLYSLMLNFKIMFVWVTPSRVIIVTKELQIQNIPSDWRGWTRCWNIHSNEFEVDIRSAWIQYVLNFIGKYSNGWIEFQLI